MTFSKQALVDAVGKLVDLEDEKAQRYGQAIEGMARFRTRHPDAWLGYDLEALNPLVELAESDPPAFSRVQELVDVKRTERGAGAIWPSVGGAKFDKVEYQRLLMQERRQRTRRAVEIENLQRPERDKLIGKKRLEFENRAGAKWGEELRSMLELSRAMAGGRLPQSQQQAVRDKFWANVDDLLDEAHEAARRKQLGGQVRGG